MPKLAKRPEISVPPKPLERINGESRTQGLDRWKRLFAAHDRHSEIEDHERNAGIGTKMSSASAPFSAISTRQPWRWSE
jgi:hypothetical protein